MLDLNRQNPRNLLTITHSKNGSSGADSASQSIRPPELTFPTKRRQIRKTCRVRRPCVLLRAVDRRSASCGPRGASLRKITRPPLQPRVLARTIAFRLTGGVLSLQLPLSSSLSLLCATTDRFLSFGRNRKQRAVVDAESSGGEVTTVTYESDFCGAFRLLLRLLLLLLLLLRVSESQSRSCTENR